MESHSKFHGSSHHQPVSHIITSRCQSHQKFLKSFLKIGDPPCFWPRESPPTAVQRAARSIPQSRRLRARPTCPGGCHHGWHIFLVKSHGKTIETWVCLKIGYIPNYSHLIGIMIILGLGVHYFQTHPHVDMHYPPVN